MSDDSQLSLGISVPSAEKAEGSIGEPPGSWKKPTWADVKAGGEGLMVATPGGWRPAELVELTVEYRGKSFKQHELAIIRQLDTGSVFEISKGELCQLRVKAKTLMDSRRMG